MRLCEAAAELFGADLLNSRRTMMLKAAAATNAPTSTVSIPLQTPAAINRRFKASADTMTNARPAKYTCQFTAGRPPRTSITENFDSLLITC
jgi:hypothetical protein